MHVGGGFDRAKEIADLVYDGNAYLSFSQFGEDLLIDVIFAGKTTPGFYVDVGAHHPRRFSNTYLLYRRGWCGINVEGDKELIPAFVAERTRDINIQALLSDKIERVDFTRFQERAVNTISIIANDHEPKDWKIIDVEQAKTTTLAKILDCHLPEEQIIDLLSVDVEGVDLNVLMGNDWIKYRPLLVIVEVDGLNLRNATIDPIVKFMDDQGYRLHAYIHISAFFLREH